MEFISLEKEEVEYPIGVNITANMHILIAMADAIDKRYANEKREINLWCRGSSGAMIAAVVSAHLSKRKVNINHVKKEGESSHSKCWYKKEKNSYNVIIDDFIRSGETILKLIAEASNYVSVDCLCVTGTVYDKYRNTDIDGVYNNTYTYMYKKFKTIIASNLDATFNY